MNRKLRFSWGHIVAFLALIFIAYVVFMGATYYTVGNYYAGLITMGFCVLLIVSTILGAQVLKGVDKKFHRSVVWERILIGLSPVIIIIVGIPFSHFWTVQSSETEIKEEFRKSITSALGIFSDYDSYSKERISQLETSLNSSVKDDQLKKNRVDELTLYLDNSTAKSIEEAKVWVNKVNEDPSIWNVFLFGNISTIESAIEQWTESLNTISKKAMSSEKEPESFSTANMNKEKALNGLTNLKSTYQEVKAPNASAILTLLICYLMLLCPYFVQERHSRNVETFFGKGYSPKPSYTHNESNEQRTKGRSKYDEF
jgi:hypothetical protein